MHSDVELTAEERAEIARIRQECADLESREKDMKLFGGSAALPLGEPRKHLQGLRRTAQLRDIPRPGEH